MLVCVLMFKQNDCVQVIFCFHVNGTIAFSNVLYKCTVLHTTSNMFAKDNKVLPLSSLFVFSFLKPKAISVFE